jgi:acid phosphatase family membrane protein YuiD
MIFILNNYPLTAALSSIVMAQFIKVPLHLLSKKTWNPRLGFSTGGMPSSHSAAVTSLATAIGIAEGISSSSFALAVVVSAITMFDAAGIRRHAGTHASFLNRLLKSSVALQQEQQERTEFKELLGHRPIEVFVGAIFGILVSFFVYYVIPHN